MKDKWSLQLLKSWPWSSTGQDVENNFEKDKYLNAYTPQAPAVFTIHSGSIRWIKVTGQYNFSRPNEYISILLCLKTKRLHHQHNTFVAERNYRTDCNIHLSEKNGIDNWQTENKATANWRQLPRVVQHQTTVFAGTTMLITELTVSSAKWKQSYS
jgi:hypothetical protein